MTDEEVWRETLRLINGARAAVGADVLHDLPRGINDDCGFCHIAHALEDVAAAWVTRS